METVKAFNAELSSLYEMKPPISKAKMTAITKGAIKAVKFYKHVVQSVEKFLQKCRPEYKIPGLYVIDSIVRQSRHQFGADKDVFAPRFSKNINFTFYFIYQCTAEEKSKVIRVLNLWQKNTVFPAEAIQPLFDMADTTHPKFKEVAMAIGSKGASSSNLSLSKSTMNSQESAGNMNGNQESSVGGYEDASNDGNQSQSLIMGNLPSLSSTEMSLAARLQHLQHLFGQEPANTAAAAAAAVAVPQPAKPPQANDTGQIRFNKKLLDFDYDDEDDEPNLGSERVKEPHSNQGQPSQQPQVSGDSLGNILNNPDIIRQLQSLQQQISRPAIAVAPVMNVGMVAHKQTNNHNIDGKEQSQEDAPFPSVDLSQPPPGFTTMNMSMGLPLSMQIPMGMAAHGLPVSGLGHQVVGFPHPPLPQQQQHLGQERKEDIFQPPQSNNGDTHENEPSRIKERDRRRSRSRSGSRNRNNQRSRHRKSRSRSRSRDRDRDSRRRRPGSRSRSRSRSLGRNRRRRSRSKDREEREKERAEREKERERKRKGLPVVKKDFLSVCSTTLWVGHLSKLVQQEELSDTFGQYGEIVSIDLIPPRGCAFVCMHRRQDAYRALTKLAGHKLQGKAITLAWAPGKGVKAKEWKDYWEVDQGVSYIPWSKLSNMTDWEALEEGGSFDEETLPSWVRNNTMENPTDLPQMIIPPGFIPIPESGLVGQGPPTPETGIDLNIPVPPMPPGSSSSGAASLTTTLPPNLPTYAMAPLGLIPGSGLVPALPLGMPPGIRLPPHGLMVAPPHGNNMSSLLGQSILAGLRPSLPNSNVGAASSIGMPPRMNLGHQGAGPPGFFNVFPPSAVPNPQQAVQQHNEDDMELEEAEDEIVKDHPQQRLGDMRDRMNWEENGKEKQRDILHQPDIRARDPPKPSGQLSLQDRLRSLANNEIPPGHPANPSNRPHFGSMEVGHNGSVGSDQDRMRMETGSLIVRSDLGIGRNVGMPMGGIDPVGGNGPMYALSPGLASSLRGAPLTSAGAPPEIGVRLLRAPNDSFGTPSRLPEEPFTPRHLLGGSAHGGGPFNNNSADNFTPTRGGMSSSPRVPIGNRGVPFDGRGGFRGPMDPADAEHRPWDEEMRWRDDERYRDVNSDWERDRPSDYSDRDRSWRDRDNDRMDNRRGGRDWGGPNRRLPPTPRNDRDRGGSSSSGGGNRDRFGRDRERSDRNDRRERSGERDRERDRGDRDKDRDHDRRSSDRRGTTRWSSGGVNSRRSPEQEKNVPPPPPPPPAPEMTPTAESVPNIVNVPEEASLPVAPPSHSSPPPPPCQNVVEDVPLPPQTVEPQSQMKEPELLVAQPSVEEAPVAHSPVVHPSVVQPSVVEPPLVQPSVVEPHVVAPPAVEPRVVEAPMVQSPVAEPPFEKEPMIQPPVAETRNEEAPLAPVMVEAEEVQPAEEAAPPNAVAVD